MDAAQNEFDPAARVTYAHPATNQRGGFCAWRQIHPYALMQQLVFAQLAEG